MNYPFPTHHADELFDRFQIEPVQYSEAEYLAAAEAWAAVLRDGLSSTLFVKLMAVTEGSWAEATIVWDAIEEHRQHGLHQYLERSARQVLNRYGAIGAERTVRRGFNDLADMGLIVMWPRAKTLGQRYRLDWVNLSIRLNQMQSQGVCIPGWVESNGFHANVK